MPNPPIRPELLARLHDLVFEVAKAAYEEGRKDMRLAILDAVQTPAVPQISSSHRSVAVRPSTERAPRGSVRSAINHVLSQHPGLTEQELGQRVSQFDPNVSARSMGGELRRRRGSLYRSDAGKWFLLARESGQGSAGPQSDPADLLNQAATGVPDAETPIAA